jgi:hypothetical protein
MATERTPRFSRATAIAGGALAGCTNESPSFDEFVDVLRERLGAADALNRSELHDVHELMNQAGRAKGHISNRPAGDSPQPEVNLSPI